MKKDKFIYKIFDNESKEFTGSYTRGNYDKYEFGSYNEARNANCHGMFKDSKKYSIKKYKVTYELIEDDV